MDIQANGVAPDNIVKMGMVDIRCECGKLLGKAKINNGEIEIKCAKCKKLVRRRLP